MPNKAKPASRQPKPRLKLPRGAVKMRCVNPDCRSEETRATYQHDHRGVAITFEMPAYTTRKDKVPHNWPCPCDKKRVSAIYLECGKCGYIGRVDMDKKRVIPPAKKKEA